jgi:hypothetical protein
LLDSSEPSPQSSALSAPSPAGASRGPRQLAEAVHGSGLAVVQVAVVGAIWDLARTGHLDQWHTFWGLLAVSVPGVATIAAGLIRQLPTAKR